MTLITGAGWNGASFRTIAELTGADSISPLAARILKEDAEELRARAQIDRERESDRQHWQERAIATSIEMARDRGEVVSIREAIRNGGVGRTRQEILAWASAQGEIEDARQLNEMRRNGLSPQDFMEPVDCGENDSKPAPFVSVNPQAYQRAETRFLARKEAEKVLGQAIPGILGATAHMAGLVGERGHYGDNW